MLRKYNVFYKDEDENRCNISKKSTENSKIFIITTTLDWTVTSVILVTLKLISKLRNRCIDSCTGINFKDEHKGSRGQPNSAEMLKCQRLMKKCKKFRCCCCPWDQEKELTMLPMWCPEFRAKGFQASCPRKGRKETSAAQLHDHCPRGNYCKILARKGKCTKCIQALPGTVFFQRKGEGLYFFPLVSLSIFEIICTFLQI